MDRLDKKTEAFNELRQAELLSPPLDEQFIIYRVRKMCEDIGDCLGDSDGSGMDLIAKLTYDSNLR